MAQKKRGLKDKPHETNPMRLIFQQCHLLRELAPLLTNQPVAGFHRARPSTTLDKASIQFICYYTPVLPKVKLKQYGSAGGGGRPPLSLARRWEASFHRIVNCRPARRCIRPVLAPAQACVRAGAGRFYCGVLRPVHDWHCVSIGAFPSAYARRCGSVGAVVLETRPAL